MDVEAAKKCCILVLCGLPASGKSSLAKIIEARLLAEGLNDCLGVNSLQCNSNRISYDELMPPHLERLLIEELPSNCESSSWKTFRAAILACVENSVLKLSGSMETVGADISTELKRSYEALLQSNSTGTDAVQLFIIDDNMYYAGMRYNYYKVAKKYNISFAQVHVTCSVAECQRRNSARETPVPENVITKMSDRFEAPDLSSSWEKHSVMIDGEKEFESQIKRIAQLISSSLEDPVRDLEAELEVKREESRVETSASTMHQIDQVLRRVVAEVMKEAKDKGLDSSEIKALSTQLRQIKPDILQDFKSGRLKLTQEECDKDFESCSERSIFHRLKLMVQEKISH